jgi:hypothetical protein
VTVVFSVSEGAVNGMKPITHPITKLALNGVQQEFCRCLSEAITKRVGTGMQFTTYENRANPHVAIHRCICNQLRKRGGVHKNEQGKYVEHATYAEARAYAEQTGLPVQDCSFCEPRPDRTSGGQ